MKKITSIINTNLNRHFNILPKMATNRHLSNMQINSYVIYYTLLLTLKSKWKKD